MEKFKNLKVPQVNKELILEGVMNSICGNYENCDDMNVSCPECVFSYENNKEVFKEYIKSDGENAKIIREVLQDLLSEK